MAVERPWREEPRELSAADYDLMRLPARQRDTELDRIVKRCGGGDEIHRPRQVVETYLDRLRTFYVEGYGLYLHGPNGSGKTAAASHVAKAYRAHGKSVCFAKAEELRVASMGEHPPVSEGRDLWAWAKRVDVLVVDDLGKEHRGRTDYAATELEVLTKHRWEAQRPTIWTANLPPEGLDGDYRESTAHIIEHSTKAVYVAGADHRAEEAERLESAFPA